jgi:hypothetical protein
MLHSCTARFNIVQVLLNLAINTPLENIGERCKDFSAIQAFFYDGMYLFTTPYVQAVIVVATEEFGKVR